MGLLFTFSLICQKRYRIKTILIFYLPFLIWIKVPVALHKTIFIHNGTSGKELYWAYVWNSFTFVLANTYDIVTPASYLLCK